MIDGPPPVSRALPERGAIDAAEFAGIVSGYAPVVLRGLAADWPAVAAARTGDEDLVRYLSGHDSGTPVEAFLGQPAMRGRYFYATDMQGFNFERRRGGLSDALAMLLKVRDATEPPCFYIGAAPVPELLPGFAEANPMQLFADAVPRAWIGNRSTVAPHFDLSDNIAVVAAGRRRFTLFPPEQLANLYIGPLDHTMAGQPASMASLDRPDFERFPRLREALGAAMTAELEPGDAIYVPSLWWHQVEALAPVNMLVNYWAEPPAGAGSPFEAMIHAIWTVSALPEPRRAAWRSLFDHYAFRPDGADPAAHLPPEHRGILAPPTPALGDRIRQFLLRGLTRR